MEEVTCGNGSLPQKELNYELTHAMVGLTPLAALRAMLRVIKDSLKNMKQFMN
jgi:hypothetical protein